MMSHRSFLSLSLLSLVACSKDDGEEIATPGVPRVCLAGPLDRDTLTDDFSLVIAEATVLSDAVAEDWSAADALDCNGTPSRVLTVEDDTTGEQWQIGYGLIDGSETDVTLPLDVTTGQSIAVHYEAVLGFGVAHGFVLRDAEGLVAAVEEGTWGSALEAEDHGLSIELSDEPYASEDDGCGTLVHRGIIIEGVLMLPWEQASIDLEGEGVVQAFAIANTALEDTNCLDASGRTSWAVLR